jgi:hypothetical protein
VPHLSIPASFYPVKDEIPTPLYTTFISETSTAKPIDTLPYLTSLDARGLTSELDLRYQPRGTSSVELDERLGLRQHLPHGFSHSFAFSYLPVVVSSLACGHVIDPNAGPALLSIPFPLSWRRLLLLYPIHIGYPFLLPRWTCCRQTRTCRKRRLSRAPPLLYFHQHRNPR